MIYTTTEIFQQARQTVFRCETSSIKAQDEHYERFLSSSGVHDSQNILQKTNIHIVY